MRVKFTRRLKDVEDGFVTDDHYARERTVIAHLDIDPDLVRQITDYRGKFTLDGEVLGVWDKIPRVETDIEKKYDHSAHKVINVKPRAYLEIICYSD